MAVPSRQGISMLRYVLRRLLTAIPTLFVIVTIAFFLMRVAPGGPFNQEKGLNPVIKGNLERVFHLDEPLWRKEKEREKKKKKKEENK